VHEHRIATRWTDFDTLGHVTHAAYPIYLDEARDAFLAGTVGSFEDWPTVIVHISIDYRREIRRPVSEVLVRTRVAEVGRTSISFEQEVVALGGEVSAMARAVVVAWDSARRRPRELDDRDRERLSPSGG
jgi:acyl-CoA thioester hydrolase